MPIKGLIVKRTDGDKRFRLSQSGKGKSFIKLQMISIEHPSPSSIFFCNTFIHSIQIENP